MRSKIIKTGLAGILGISNRLILLFFLILVFGCDISVEKEKPKKTEKKAPTIVRPNFNADSAYSFIQKQVDFGPRVPNSKAHKAAGIYLANKLKAYDFSVIEQKTTVKAYDGSSLAITNIIGEYMSELKNRILLFAHWDSRHVADHDTVDTDMPILGANDGGSGVGVLLEIARQIQLLNPKIGVDIVLFDGEDYGQPSNEGQYSSMDSWCLGSQYWSTTPHRPNYSANFGILLDMVGAQNAYFTKEAYSRKYAPHVLDKVWGIAASLGHQNHFVFNESEHVGVDDHVYVNKIRRIPSIDIIQYDPNTKAFAPHWHTHQDNMEVIDKNTLSAVGETVLATVLQEAKLLK